MLLYMVIQQGNEMGWLYIITEPLNQIQHKLETKTMLKGDSLFEQ